MTEHVHHGDVTGTDAQLNQVAAAQLAIDGEVEQRKLAPNPFKVFDEHGALVIGELLVAGVKPCEFGWRLVRNIRRAVFARDRDHADRLRPVLQLPAGHRQKGAFGDIVATPNDNSLRSFSVKLPNKRGPGCKCIIGIESPVIVAAVHRPHVVDARITVIERTVAQIIWYADCNARQTMGLTGAAQTTRGAVTQGKMHQSTHKNCLSCSTSPFAFTLQ